MKAEAQVDQAKIETLIGQLKSRSGSTRERAREMLVEVGNADVTRALIFELNDSRRDVRWEAAKALISIADPVAAPALVHHLLDNDGDIRWLAAEGLASLGTAGLLATLNASIRYSGTPEFCEAARHAFKEFQKQGYSVERIEAVIAACESAEPGVSVPVAAYKLLQEIKPGAEPPT